MRHPTHPPLDAPPSTCDTCAHGCPCPPTGPGCGHYGCFGAAPHTCPGVDAEEARYAARLAEKRAADARTHNRRAAHHAAVDAALAAVIAPRKATP